MVFQGAIVVIIADASGAFCHLVHRARTGRAVSQRRHSVVDAFNEFPALQPVSALEHRYRAGQRKRQ
jgi:hypothetical protein